MSSSILINSFIEFPPAGGGSDPNSIGSGLLFWYQNGAGRWQDTGKTTPAADTDPVRVWADQSANGNDQTIALYGDAARPVGTAGGLHFDGAGDILIAENAVTLKPATFFCILNLDSIAGANGVIGGGSTAFFVMTSGNALQLRAQSVAVIATSTATLAATTDYRIIITYDGSGNYAFYVDGAAEGSGTQNETIGSFAPYLSVVDAGVPLGGTIRDLGAYDNVLSGGDITALDDYLASI